MPTLLPAEVRRRRLAAQRLTSPGPHTAAAVVERLGCVQSQEWAHGFWSLGLRTTGSTYAGVRDEFDAGAFVRTHILRPTWHYVDPADLQWMLALTAPRVHQRNAGTYRRLGLDEDLLRRAAAIMVEATGETPRTRPELAKIIAQSGIKTGDGMWLAHVVMWAELEGLICSGALRGQQHTYVPLQQRIDPATERHPDDPGAELAWRFLRGRGPSAAADLARWSSLTMTEVRSSLGRLGNRIESAEVVGEDESVWWVPEDDHDVHHDDQQRVWWLPLYDEFPLSHTAIRIPPVSGHPHQAGSDVFVGSVIMTDSDDGAVDLGFWKRIVRGRTVELETRLAAGLGREQLAAVDTAGEALRSFLTA